MKAFCPTCKAMKEFAHFDKTGHKPLMSKSQRVALRKAKIEKHPKKGGKR